MSEWVPDGHSFAVCLTHDVDRPYKTYQSLFYALTERDPSHLQSLFPEHNPYWTFDEIVELEASLGVTSAFYFLDEQSLFGDRPTSEWFSLDGWRLYAGRYDIEHPDVASTIRELDRRGWEVGLHGSYESYLDRSLLGEEKAHLEDVLGHEVVGGRQHYLNLERPETWARQRDAGLQYDASPGSSSEFGFQEGYEPFRPFDDEFVVFPTTVMECALPDPGTEPQAAWRACEEVLAEAEAESAVATLLWHPRYFSEDYPGYDWLYRRTIERAQAMGAWVGPPGELYERFGRVEAPTAAEPAVADSND